MSKDQMQDVFPIVFDFKKGEAPTAEKLTGLVRQVDTALSEATQAIGDPWDQQLNELSLERLAQPSLARIIGPSDYLSPMGGSFNETISVIVILSSNRNQWNLGFPLVGHNTIREDSAGPLTNLVWGTPEIVVNSDPNNVLSTIKTNLTSLAANGDFHVDYNTGTITSYKPHTTGTLQLTITNLNFLGSGAPWATPNVIPTWEETSVFCNLVLTGSGGGISSYTLDLPTIESVPRIDTSNWIYGGIKSYSVSTADAVILTGTGSAAGFPGQGSQYRLPQALLDNYSVGDELPEGYIYLWDNSTNRIIPSVVFYRGSDEHTLTITAPTGWLNVGSNQYRIIISGASIAETVNYLASTARDDRHIGLTAGALTRKSHFYSSPISHDTLTNRYSNNSSSTSARLLFRESSMATNCHPQYLHRYGFYADDNDGNHANAMMGDVVFTNQSTYSYIVDSGSLTPADLGTTYGVRFGGSRTAPNNYASIDFAGGQAVNTFATATALDNRNPVASRIGFGLNGVGVKHPDDDEDTGTLCYSPRYDGPLYIRGKSIAGLSIPRETDEKTDYMGGAIGFDIGRRNELNYIKLFPAIRTEDEVANQPAKMAQTDFSSSLSITPELSTRLCAEQIREFRVRGGAYLNDATNWAEGLASTSSFGTARDGIVEFDVYGLSTVGSKRIILESSYGDISKTFIVGRQIKVSGATNSSNNGYKTIDSVSYSAPYTIIYVNSGDTITTESSSPAKATMQMKEFDAYFTSPGMVGADFFNVYSNAVFFSDTGDGKRTSFTERGKAWLDGNYDIESSYTPTGLYYVPGSEAHFIFSLIDDLLIDIPTQPFSFGSVYGFKYAGSGDIDFTTTADISLVGKIISLESSLDNININTSGTSNHINLTTADSTSNITISSGNDINLLATSDVSIQSIDEDVSINGNNINIVASTSSIVLDSSWVYCCANAGAGNATFVIYNLPSQTPSSTYKYLLIDDSTGRIYKSTTPV